MIERMGMLFRRLMIQLTADRRKFSVLCALLVLGLLFWARIIVIKNLPRTALAEDGIAAVDEHAESENSSGSENSAHTVRTVMLDSVPARDPFTLSGIWFPKNEEPALVSSDGPKLSRTSSEDPEQAISRLRLEAVMQGSPLAVISGRTYRPGDWVEVDGLKFVLLEVQRRSVLLEHGGRHFELRLNGPGT